MLQSGIGMTGPYRACMRLRPPVPAPAPAPRCGRSGCGVRAQPLLQCRIDTGLPPRPGGFEGCQHIGIHAHVQRGPLDGGGGAATASPDGGGAPEGRHGSGIVRVVRLGLGIEGDGGILRGFALNALSVGAKFSGGLASGHTASFPVFTTLGRFQRQFVACVE